MIEAAKRMEGERDFAAFGNVGSPRKSTIRRVDHVRLVMRRERFAIIVQGNGFLYNMVRTMAGTLIAVGKGRMSPDDVTLALDQRDRKLAGPTAPPSGLYLVRVLYPEPIFRGREQGPGEAPGPLRY